jgi:choline dehydrogenase
MRPFSRGTVRLSCSNNRPIVDPNYFDDDRDMRAMIAGLRMARDIGSASSLEPWRGEEVSPGPGVQSDEDLRAFVWKNFTSYTHLVGTCAMGDTPHSVVDAQLRVRGIDGVRVADASVMPTVPSSNTVATVYALAERAIELIVRN